MQQKLHHKRIDLFKMDIEGFEWPMFESWPVLADQKRSEELSLPMQILVEVRTDEWSQIGVFSFVMSFSLFANTIL
jgi:hypothetical protein